MIAKRFFMFKKFIDFQGRRKQFNIWFLSYLAIVAVGIILSFFLHFSSTEIVRNQTEKNMYFTVDQMRLFYDEDFIGIKDAAYSVLGDSSIQTLADTYPESDPTARRIQCNNIRQRISRHIDDNISKFYVMFEDFDLIIDSTGTAGKSSVYRNTFKEYYPTVEQWLQAFSMEDMHENCLYIKGNNSSIVCYLQRIPLSTATDLKATAIIVMNMEKIVENRLNVAAYTNPVMTILSHNDEIVFSTASLGDNGSSVSKSDDYIQVSVPSQFMNWKYMLTIPSQNVYSDLNNLRTIALLTYILYLIAGIFLSYYLSKKSYRPLSLLLTKFGKASPHGTQNEFLYLGDQISRMFEKDELTQKELNSQMSKLQEHYLAGLLYGHKKDALSKKDYCVEFKKGYFCLVLFRITDAGIFADDKSSENIHFLIQNVFSEITENLGTTYFFPCDDTFACIINSKKEISELDICGKTEFTVKFLYENFSAHIICAVSDSASSENQLPALYTQAKDIISIALNSSENAVLASDVLGTVPYIFPIETEHMLTSALMRGKYGEAEEIIDGIFRKTFENKMLIPSMSQVFFCDLISTVLRVSSVLNDSKSFSTLFNDVFYAEGVEESKNILLDYIKILCDKIAENTESVDDRINQITEFVQSNYHDPNLNVSYIANKFDITINYLSSYFKTKTGQVLSDYILKYRLEKACEMLKDKISVTETCHGCGFCDVNAFIRAFKKNYGVTPGKYSSQNN